MEFKREGRRSESSITRLMSFLSTHTLVDARNTLFSIVTGVAAAQYRWYLARALTIPRSKCTLMDCIKQRDKGVGGNRGEGGRGGRRGWAALGRLPAGEQPAMADRRAERLHSPLLSSPANFSSNRTSSFDLRITLIFLEEEEEERKGWLDFGENKGMDR